ncbi:MAG: DUF6787 family protein [Cyclobacteriaceae bacterium]
MSWLHQLQSRWKVNSLTQVVLILTTFALTGTTVVYISKPLLAAIFGSSGVPVWAKIIYYILILPVYNLFLLAYGFLLGQFSFFWQFEKRTLKRMSAIFVRKKTE